MKSLLVDALRQANKDGSGRTLSDSGSFAASRDEFDTTANDESIGALSDIGTDLSVADELELLDTVSAAGDEDLDGEQDSDATPATPVSVSDSEFLPVNNTTYGDMPLLARYAPLLCVCLAISAAGLWAMYLSVGARDSTTALGAVFAESRTLLPSDDLAQVTAMERFPFLSTPESPTTQESSE